MINKDQKKLLKEEFDNISFSKDGKFITTKNGYFYRHGQTSESWAKKSLDKIKSIIPDIQIEIFDHEDSWKSWPKNSYFIAKFKIVESSGLHPHGLDIYLDSLDEDQI